MVVLHIGPIGQYRISGLNTCITGMAQAQACLPDVAVALLISAGVGPDGGGLTFPVFYHCESRSVKALHHPFNRPDIAVLHDTYVLRHVKIARELGRMGVPYVIVPHGGMTDWAQNVKALKKTCGNILFFDRLVGEAKAIHYVTENEMRRSQRWHAPSLVVGYGTHIPETNELACPGVRDELRFVFIGRLDPWHKGLDLLISACHCLHDTLLDNQVQVLLYGPDYHGGRRKVMEQIQGLSLQQVMQLHEPVLGTEKESAFRSTDVFVHTSRSEGQPQAVLEALARGLPCLLTPGTNISTEVAAAGAGWAADQTATDIAKTMSRIIRNRHEIPAAGERARQYAIENCDWHKNARKTVEAYERLLNE